MRFTQLNCLALLAALAIFSVCIAASVVNWFSFTQSYQITTVSSIGTSTQTVFNSTSSTWSLVGVTTTISPTNGVSTNTFTQYNSTTSIWSIFKLLQSFVLIALILAGLLSIFLVLCFACAIRNQLLFVLGMNVLRVSLLIIATLILASLIIAFLGFLGITGAFSNDNPSCTYGYCRRLSDTQSADLGTQTMMLGGVSTTGDVTYSTSWGPIAGWYLILGCIPVAIVLAIIVVINKFPIPVDSVTIGEAL